MAIASLIINDDTRRSVLAAQDADVAPTTVGVMYWRFMKVCLNKQILSLLAKVHQNVPPTMASQAPPCSMAYWNI